MAEFAHLAVLDPALDARLDEILRAKRIVGAAIAVVRGQDAFVKVHGVRRAGTTEPVTPRTAFDIGSCSKSYVATAIALLVSDGKIALDDPVRRYLPEFELDDPWISEHVSVRDLLANRIGLRRQVPVESFANPDIRPREVFRRLKHLDRVHPFRGGYVYFNPGFMAAAHIVEQVSGAKYAQFLEERLFHPLGMSDSASGLRPFATLSERAAGHVLSDNGAQCVDEPVFDNWQGAGGIYSSAADATRWLRFLLSGGVGSSGRLIDASALAETHRPHTIMPAAETRLMHKPPQAQQCAYCLGWWSTQLHERLLIQHAGGMFGWAAQHAIVPSERIAVAVYLSVGEYYAAPICYEVIETLLGCPRRDWMSTQDQETAARAADFSRLMAVSFPCTRGARSTVRINAFAGRYGHPACGVLEVESTSDGLNAKLLDGRLWDMTLHHIGDDVFEVGWRPSVAQYFPAPARARFIVQEGRVAAFEDINARYERLG